MCGIFGAINKDISPRIDGILMSLAKRGPDGHGIYNTPDNSATFIHTRLSIIDTSSNANQPMKFGNDIIVFNGEIYNYITIRKELEALGYIFQTHSDTEVVLLSFNKWGEKCVDRFNGIFAFGIYNVVSREFFAARDNFGVKPFYYYCRENFILFSSLLCSLLESGVPIRKLNKKGLAIFLDKGSFSTEENIVEGIIQLSPGHILKFKDGVVELKQFWSIRDGFDNKVGTLNYRERVKVLREKLETSAQLLLVADVPVGAFLSSGVDSAIAVGLMSRYSRSKLDTFTLGFKDTDPKLNEIYGARLISKLNNTNHHELIINDAIVDVVDDFINSIDQPSVDGLNSYLISKETSRYTKVAISGLGADELFGGYPHFSHAMISDESPIKWMIRMIKYTRLNNFFTVRHDEVFNSISSIRDKHFEQIRSYGKTQNRNEKIKNHVSSLGDSSLFWNDNSQSVIKDLDLVQLMSFWEINNYMLNTLLRDSDALSMSQSLEVRPIFLEKELATYVFNLKARDKVNFFNRKRILKDACEDLIPKFVLNRAKTGFELPLIKWMSNDLKLEFLKLLTSKRSIDLFSDEYRKYLIHSVTNNQTNAMHWGIFVLFKFIELHNIEIN